MALENVFGPLALDATLASVIKTEDTPHVSGDKGIVVLGVRRDEDTPLSSDTDYSPFLFDEDGRVKVGSKAQRNIFRCTFSNTIASGVDSDIFNIIRGIGTGQTVAQSAGNLVLTSGTTINQETTLRSTRSFTGSMISRIQTILSQRIANNNFFVELVDVVGDGLACTINSATSITVTIPSNPFTAQNVGQGMYLGMYAGTGTFVPQRATIASVSGNDVTYTVAGMVVGTGSCSVFGWNYYQTNYNGTTATQVNYDTQRRGWSSGSSSLGINTTASPGHLSIMQNDDGNAYYLDQLVATSVNPQITLRGSRVVSIPEENTPLFLQIRMVNGTTAPASNTTWTLGIASIEKFSPTPISMYSIKPQGAGNPMPVQLLNSSVALNTGTNNVGNVGLLAANARIGFQASSGIWYDDTTTPLGINGFFTGVSRDLTVTVTGTAWGNGLTFGKEFRVSAESDVTGTLFIEVSRDGTNWRRIKQVATTLLSGSGSFYAEIIHLPTTRYIRAIYQNGATAQTRFMLQTFILAS